MICRGQVGIDGATKRHARESGKERFAYAIFSREKGQ
jgi:hypothetical protein